MEDPHITTADVTQQIKKYKRKYISWTGWNKTRLIENPWK